MKRCIFFLLTFCWVVAYSQDDPKVIVFKPDDNGPNKSGGLMGDQSNILKLGVAEMFLGDYSLFFERALADFASFEVGAGFTKRRDPSIGPFNFDILEDMTVPDELISRLGSSFSLGFRLYPDYVLEDWYFSVEVKWRNYNWTNSGYSVYDWDTQTSSSIGPVDESFRVFYPRVSSGYSAVFGDRLVVDYFGGIGLARATRNTFNFNTEQVEQTQNRVLWFHVGLRFGLLF
jgi:hypothetical protein